MKIVDRGTFLSMPRNTLFSKYAPCIFDDLSIKGESLRGDFYFQQISGAISRGSIGSALMHFYRGETSSSLKMDFKCESCDSMYDLDQLFAVWEKEDVEQLIERLKECI